MPVNSVRRIHAKPASGLAASAGTGTGITLSFSVASYNVLATAYIRRAYYPRTPALILDRTWRVPVAVQHISRFDTDIICLQEVETEMLGPLRLRLGELGYGYEFVRRGGGRPDGCATFYRSNRFELTGASSISSDGQTADIRASGHIALVTTFNDGERSLGVINTHLTWDPPDTPRERRAGRRQLQQLLDEYKKLRGAAHAWIVAGDLNVTPDDEILPMLENAGFDYAHRFSGCYTCKVNAEAKMIDYLLYSSSLTAEAERPAAIADHTILPSAEEPSDHVPIFSRFCWQA